MSLTLSEAQSIVSNALDDPNNDYVTLAQLTNWINEGCLDIARRSQTLQQMATIPVIALQNIYTMPTNLLSVHRMEYIPSGQIYPNQQIYPLVYRAINDMDQVWGVNQGSQSTYPQFFTPWSNPPNLTVQLFPVPAQSGTLNVWYYRTATPVINGGDLLDVVEGFQGLVCMFAEYMAKRKAADPTWKDAKEIYEADFQELINRTRSYTDQAGTFTSGPTGQPNWLYEMGDY
jgi:hypothetical protein